MPQLTAPPQITEVNLDAQPFRFGTSTITDQYALTLVNKTFNKYESERQKNEDKRWMDNDRLYTGWIPKRTWPDKKTPRSSLGIPIAFDVIESMLPMLLDGLFGGPDPTFFQVSPTPFSSVEGALATEAALAYQLETPQDRSGTSARVHITTAIMDLLQHGAGALELGFRPDTGTFFVDWVPVKDLYIDPDLAMPLIDRSEAVIRRKFVTIEELEALRGQPGFNIPSPAVLNWLSHHSPTSVGADQISNHLASLRSQGNSTTFAQGVNPAARKIELLEYWADSREIWVLGRRATILNIANPYRTKPFVFAPCYQFLGRAYGMGIPDVVEGDQLYIQGIVNARIDELSLNLNPYRIRKGQASTSPKNAFAPGNVDVVGDAKDVIFQFPNNITQGAFEEVALAERRVEKRTGINALAQSGVPQPGNVNRTGVGVRAQQSGSSTRASSVLGRIEDYLITPMLYKLQFIMNAILPESLPTVPARRGDQVGFVPRELLNQPVLFIMKASRRIITRDKLAQVFDPVMRSILAPPVLQAAAQAGQTVDFSTVNRFIAQASDTSDRFEFFRPMNEQEQAQLNQPSPDEQLKAQQEQQSQQVRLAMAQIKSQTELQKQQLENQGTADNVAERSAIELLKLIVSQIQGDKENALSLVQEAIKSRNANTNGPGGSGSTSS